MSYDILIPSLPFIGAYLVTYSLYNLGFIRKALHINLWNFIIVLAFLLSGGAGFLLLILMEAGITLQINPSLLYWHVEIGITLALIGLFHFRDYWKSAKRMFLLQGGLN